MFKIKLIRTGLSDNADILQEEFDFLKRHTNFFIQKYLVHDEEHVEFFRKNGIKAIFIYRDPRDQKASFSYFAHKTGMWPELSPFDMGHNISLLIRDCSIIGPTNKIWGNVKGIDDYYNHFIHWMK